MIENIDTVFFRKVLELENYDAFFAIVTELSEFKDYLTYYDFLILRNSLFKEIANNNYNFENIDDEIRKKISKSFSETILKLYSYMNYLSYRKKINLEERVDVLKYYGDIKNIDERICAYSNIDNIDCVEYKDVLDYIVTISKEGKKDDIALSILLNKVSLEETEKYYEQLIEKMKNFLIKYKKVIEELNNKKLLEELFEYFYKSILGWSNEYYMFSQMIEYLKVNNLKKDKIYTVLKKVEELKIDKLNISVKPSLPSEIHDVYISKFKEAYYYTEKKETIKNGYAGTYIYTDGIKNWLIKTKIGNYKNNFEDTYKMEISDFNYVLINNKLIDRGEDCCGPFFGGPYLNRTTTMQIYDFDMDISTLPTYEELYSFNIEPQVDFTKVQEKTEAVDTILQIEMAIKDIQKFLNKLIKLQEKLQIIKNSNEYKAVFLQIESLERLIEQMGAMKSATYTEYLKEGITELKELVILKKKKEN